MARSVFFSFHYDDVKNFKANIVRQNHRFKKKLNTDNFSDGSIWEDKKPRSGKEIENIINELGVKNTSVTTVLIGSETFNRKWVRYEIVRSFVKGNGILGVHINRIKGRVGIEKKGKNPFDHLRVKVDEHGKLYFEELVNRSWKEFKLLPEVNNRKTNTIYFKEIGFFESWVKDDPFGKTFKFSEFFPTYCWVNDDGNQNFPVWIEEAYGTKIHP